MPPAISVVVPLWNEGENVRPLAKRILEALREEPGGIELLLVDDASTDTTWQQMHEVRQANPQVRALRLLRHSGQSAALWAGFEASQGAVIATLDGDLQNDPADLPGMLARLKQCDLVCGVRTKRMDNALRRLSSKIARLARRLVLGVDFQDTGCNLRVFKRSTLKMILPFDGIHRFMPILAQGAGAVVVEMPVSHQPRSAGRSKYGVWNRLWRGIFDLVMVRLYRKRQLKRVPVFESADNAQETPHMV